MIKPVTFGVLLLLFSSTTMAQGSVRLTCQPRSFDVIPGEPMRLELMMEGDSAAPIHLHIPSHPSLVLRAVEKYPMRRSSKGNIVHRRVVVWQAVGPGLIKVEGISVKTTGIERRFPVVIITVKDPGT